MENIQQVEAEPQPVEAEPQPQPPFKMVLCVRERGDVQILNFDRHVVEMWSDTSDKDLLVDIQNLQRRYPGLIDYKGKRNESRVDNFKIAGAIVKAGAHILTAMGILKLCRDAQLGWKEAGSPPLVKITVLENLLGRGKEKKKKTE